MPFNRYIYSFQNKAFDIVIILTWILYIAILFGLSTKAPKYLDDLQYYIKIYVSFFLILRFNPFRRVKFTGLDAKIAFNAGIFLLATTAITSILQNYLQDIKRVLF